jgi:hypothetical protein
MAMPQRRREEVGRAVRGTPGRDYARAAAFRGLPALPTVTEALPIVASPRWTRPRICPSLLLCRVLRRTRVKTIPPKLSVCHLKRL